MRQHWYTVSELALRLDISVPDIERFIEEPSSVVPSRELQKLHMACSIAMIDGSPSLQAWVKRSILAHLGSLKVLSLHMGTIPLLPRLPQLKNLVLHTRRSLPPEAFHHIQQLPSLTSLWLGCKDVYMQDYQYEVDLALCPQLQRVCFNTTVPKVLKLPAACHVAVKCTARRAMADGGMWREHCALLEVHLTHNLGCVPWRKDFRYFLGAAGLPPFLLLTCLTLHAESLGNRADYMVVCGNYLPKLADLRIRCLTLAIRIEASARLKTLSLNVESVLRIEVVSYSALCSTLERMYCYSPVDDCHGAPVSIGRRLQQSRRFPRDASWTFQRVSVLNSSGKPKVMAAFAFPKDAIHDDVQQCKCQSCAACLMGV